MEARRILIFTGDGKGKTTAALGMALRAAGHGMRTLVVQFIKADPSTGEVVACKALPGIEIVQAGRGFVPGRGDPSFEDHRRAAQEGLALAGRALEKEDCDLLILDEICPAVVRGLLEEKDVLTVIEKGYPGVCVVLTGRGATPGLVARADTVTEMKALRHGLTSGLTARKGVEY
jgi:cob(I)alamin adenosyltransferase